MGDALTRVVNLVTMYLLCQDAVPCHLRGYIAALNTQAALQLRRSGAKHLAMSMGIGHEY